MHKTLKLCVKLAIPRGAYVVCRGHGRAIVLGEHLAPDGQRVDIQLKWAGPTPYTRSGDRRAALAPMLRE